MDNIFDRIKSRLPKPNAQTAQKLKVFQESNKPQPSPVNGMEQPKAPQTINQTIQRWADSKYKDTQAASRILQHVRPTIDSALTSYAQGQERNLRIRAAQLSLQALKSFDPKKNVAPATYVFHNLKRLNRLRAQREQIIHTPENRRMAYGQLAQKRSQFQDMYGRQPSMQELADLTGLSIKKLQSLTDTQGTITSQTGTQSAETHDSTFAQPDVGQRQYYDYVYRSVSPIDQKIMQWSSGWSKKGLMLSNNEIAKRLKISPPAVSQRRQKIQQMLADIRRLI